MSKIKPGDIFQTNEGGTCVVIQYGGCYEIIIEHQDDHRHRAKVTSSQLRDGRIKNPFRPRVFGVGFIGVGKNKCAQNGRDTHQYTTWHGMLERCYSEKFKQTNSAYAGCTVDPRWHNFQRFCDWYDKQEFKGKGHQLDKDILIKGNRIYGPESCRFVPSAINKLLMDNRWKRGSLPVGVTFYAGKFCAHISKNGKQTYVGRYETVEEAFSYYKESREEYIRDIANKHKNQMSPEIYDALIKYSIEITD